MKKDNTMSAKTFLKSLEIKNGKTSSSPHPIIINGAIEFQTNTLKKINFENLTFNGPVTFNNLDQCDIHIYDCIFKENVTFKGASKLHIYTTKFHGTCTWNNNYNEIVCDAVFNGICIIENAHFAEGINWQESTFNSTMKIINASVKQFNLDKARGAAITCEESTTFGLFDCGTSIFTDVTLGKSTIDEFHGSRGVITSCLKCEDATFLQFYVHSLLVRDLHLSNAQFMRFYAGYDLQLAQRVALHKQGVETFV